MKKLLALLLAAVMVLSLAACSGSKEAEYKLGMGIVVEDSTKTGTAQIDATVATVVLDKDGKIVSCKLDVAQTKMAIADGQAVTTDVDLRTKNEKGEAYNMKKFGGSIAEWNEQAEFFAKAVVGKTGAEVSAMATATTDDGHVRSTDSAILAGCTISIAEFKEAIVKACNDEYAKTFKASEFKHGLGVVTSVDKSSASATADADGAANMYTDFGAVVVDANGNVLADLVDAIQPKIAFDLTGNETSYNFNGTKKELKDGYNMKAFGGSLAEWMDEATSFENYIVGKNASAVAGIVLENEADLLASCTIHIDGFQGVLAKAFSSAK